MYNHVWVKSLKSNHAFNAIREIHPPRKQTTSVYGGFSTDTFFKKNERRPPVLGGLRIPKICERQKMTTV